MSSVSVAKRRGTKRLASMPARSVCAVVSQSAIDAMVASGKAVDVTVLAGKVFPAGRVAIDSAVYEQHIAWPNKAMRDHMMYLDEEQRLGVFLQSAAVAMRHASPAEFTHRGIACDAPSSNPVRHAFVLQRMDDSARLGWLIRQ